MNLKPFLKLMAEKNASDLFFTPTSPIVRMWSGRFSLM